MTKKTGNIVKLRLFIAILLIGTISPVFGMAYIKSWLGWNQTPTEQLAKLNLAKGDRGDLWSAMEIETNIQKIKVLVQQGANPNTANSPLHYAVAHNDAELVRFLLEHGADATRQNYTGDSAYEEALWHNNPAVVEVFLTTKTNPAIDPTINYRLPKPIPGLPGAALQRTMFTTQANDPVKRQAIEKMIQEYKKEKLP